MEGLPKLRKQIDEIDEDLLTSLKKRMQVCESVGAVKRKQGTPVRDLQREREKYKHIAGKAREFGLDPDAIVQIYKKIIAMGVRVQQPERQDAANAEKASGGGGQPEGGAMTLHGIAERVVQLEKEGKRVVKFNVGDPDQPTPLEIVDAMITALRQGKTKYSSSGGEKRLREALAELHEAAPEQVVVTPGSKWAVFSLMSLLLKKGDNVVIVSPHWSDYETIAKTFGAETRLFKTELDADWWIDVAELERLMDEHTRLLIVNNPNNPTSRTIRSTELAELTQVANAHGTRILSDEVYMDVSFVETESIRSFEGAHLLVKSFSKTFAMTGWRIGYAVVDDELAKKMMGLNQITVSNVPSFIQDAALRALELRDDIRQSMRAIYQQRADLACRILARAKLEFTEPEAPFYVFPRKADVNSEQLAAKLLRRGVAIVPGSCFGDYPDHFRIALTVPEEEIEAGLNMLCEELG
jgi:aspartate aminotransferase